MRRLNPYEVLLIESTMRLTEAEDFEPKSEAVRNAVESVQANKKGIFSDVTNWLKSLYNDDVKPLLKKTWLSITYFLKNYTLYALAAFGITALMIYANSEILPSLMNKDKDSVLAKMRNALRKVASFPLVQAKFISLRIRTTVVVSSFYVLYRIFRGLLSTESLYYAQEAAKEAAALQELEKQKGKMKPDEYEKAKKEITNRQNKLMGIVARADKRSKDIEDLDRPTTLLEAQGIAEAGVIFTVLWATALFLANFALVLSVKFRSFKDGVKAVAVLAALGMSNLK